MNSFEDSILQGRRLRRKKVEHDGISPWQGERAFSAKPVKNFANYLGTSFL